MKQYYTEPLIHSTIARLAAGYTLERFPMRLPSIVTLTAAEWLSFEVLRHAFCPPADGAVAIKRTEERSLQVAIHREAFDNIRDAITALQWHRQETSETAGLALPEIRQKERSLHPSDKKRLKVDAALGGGDDNVFRFVPEIDSEAMAEMSNDDIDRAKYEAGYLYRRLVAERERRAGKSLSSKKAGSK
jgi:hypothetical protein